MIIRGNIRLTDLCSSSLKTLALGFLSFLFSMRTNAMDMTITAAAAMGNAPGELMEENPDIWYDNIKIMILNSSNSHAKAFSPLRRLLISSMMCISLWQASIR